MDESGGFLVPARRDAKIALQLLAADDEDFNAGICFHAQQAAEKSLKQVFVENGATPDRTHNLNDLQAAASAAGWIETTKESVMAAMNLTRHAVATRYVMSADVTRGEAQQAVLDCNAIAEVLVASGYDAARIATPARYLRNE